MNIVFEKVSNKYQEIIFNWLNEPHIKEFWDNSKEHKDDILNFINGKKQHYFYGTTNYWIGLIDNEPFSFILSDIISPEQKLSKIQRKYLSKLGTTITLDFGIGNKKYLGCGLAASTLKQFINFYRNEIDSLADTFFIDPDESNPRAQHVYTKAGFNLVGEFNVTDGKFKGSLAKLMVKNMHINLELKA